MDETIGRWGPSGYPFQLRLTSYKGGRFVDIRRYYEDQPTRKGIMLRAEQLNGLVERLVENRQRIDTWFAIEGNLIAENLARLHDRSEDARRDALLTPHSSAEPERRVRPGLSLFDVRFEGGRAVVELNSDHRFYQRFLTALSEGDRATGEELLAAVLQSCFHAAALAGGEGQRLDLDFAEQLAHFMGLILAQSDGLRDE